MSDIQRFMHRKGSSSAAFRSTPAQWLSGHAGCIARKTIRVALGRHCRARGGGRFGLGEATYLPHHQPAECPGQRDRRG
jgi:hypothetical protein